MTILAHSGSRLHYTFAVRLDFHFSHTV
jgi:hypothetical protein